MLAVLPYETVAIASSKINNIVTSPLAVDIYNG